jgi:ParB-like chromosome segregation protein Spo0J
MGDIPAPAAFNLACVDIPMADILPLKQLVPKIRKSIKYRQIAASMTEVGLIEPLVVFPTGRKNYLLLDGHLRLDILVQQQATVVRCIIATDDEAYTYNKRVNRLAPIQEHYMILKALRHGVAEERIASALRVDVATIKIKRDMLDGICAEAAQLLKDQRATAATFQVLRKMKPVRQVEAAELMLAAHNYSVRYAKLLLAGTAANMLLDPEKHRPAPGLTADQQRTMQREMDTVLRDLKTVEANYGEDVVTLTVSCRYIAHLLTNSRVERYLTKNHSDLLAEIRTLLAAVDLEKSPPPSGPVTAAVLAARQSRPNPPSIHA